MEPMAHAGPKAFLSHRRSLRRVLALGFGLILTLTSALGLLIVTRNEIARRERLIIRTQVEPAISDIQELITTISFQNEALRGYLLSRMDFELNTYRAQAAQVEVTLRRLEGRPLNTQERALLANLRASVWRYQEVSEANLLDIHLGDPALRLSRHMELMRRSYIPVFNVSRDLRDNLYQRARVQREHLALLESRLTLAVTLGFTLLLACILYIAGFTTQALSRPVRVLVHAAHSLERGDYERGKSLAVGIVERSITELAVIGGAFGRMAEQLETREREMEDWNRRLEARVQEQTAELRQTYQERERLMNALHDAVLTGDVDGVCRYVNPRAATMWGRDAGAMVGQPLRALFADADAFKEAWRQVLAGETVEMVTLDGRGPSGERLPLSWNFAPLLAEGAVVGGVGIARDLRPLMELQNRLRQADRLSAVGMLGANLAHELRNPLGAISNAAYYLRRHVRSDNERVERHLDMMPSEITRMVDIIGQLEEFSQLDKPEMRRVDVHEAITRVLAAAPPPPGVTVETRSTENLPRVLCDPAHLDRAIGNVVRNAYQALEEGGTVTIATAAHDRAVVLSVEDTGPGIPPEVLPRLFDPLNSSRNIGMGLGLALTQHILVAHGGTVRAENRPEGGARFTLTLPTG